MTVNDKGTIFTIGIFTMGEKRRAGCGEDLRKRPMYRKAWLSCGDEGPSCSGGMRDVDCRRKLEGWWHDSQSVCGDVTVSISFIVPRSVRRSCVTQLITAWPSTQT